MGMFTAEEKRNIRDKDKMRHILNEQLNKVMNLHEEDLEKLQKEFSNQRKKLAEQHAKEINELQLSLKENEDTILNILAEVESKKGGIIDVEELSKVLTIIDNEYEHKRTAPKKRTKGKYY